MTIGVFGEEIFTLVFGDDWGVAGYYGQLLAPMFYFKFSVSPLLSSFYVSNKLNFDLLGQIIYAILVVASLLVGYMMNSIVWTVVLISIFGSLFYLTFLAITYKLSKA